jgi:hypothetical protein
MLEEEVALGQAFGGVVARKMAKMEILDPANDYSRGLDAEQFLSNERWLQGPQFLWEKEESWPNSPLSLY